MGVKAGLQSQVLFALGVLIVLIAIIGGFVSEFRLRYALGGLLGLVFAFRAWRQMRR
jgi:hypothetical protein